VALAGSTRYIDKHMHIKVLIYSMQTIAATNMLRNIPASVRCQACNTSMAAPQACGSSASQRMTFSSFAGSAASMQPRKHSLHARRQRQRLAPSRAAVLCTLRNFDWPEVLLAQRILSAVATFSIILVASISMMALQDLWLRALPQHVRQLRCLTACDKIRLPTRSPPC
jgi:hypothetical protein